MAKELRSGYTTGACAAAGVKAALLYEQGEDWDSIELRALDGTELLIPVKNIVKDERGLTAEVVKFSGDDPDITNGVEARAVCAGGSAVHQSRPPAVNPQCCS